MSVHAEMASYMLTSSAQSATQQIAKENNLFPKI